jgi:hypothetical protein
MLDYQRVHISAYKRIPHELTAMCLQAILYHFVPHQAFDPPPGEERHLVSQSGCGTFDSDDSINHDQDQSIVRHHTIIIIIINHGLLEIMMIKQKSGFCGTMF